MSLWTWRESGKCIIIVNEAEIDIVAHAYGIEGLLSKIRARAREKDQSHFSATFCA